MSNEIWPWSAVFENVCMILVAFASIYILPGHWKWFFVIPVFWMNIPKRRK